MQKVRIGAMHFFSYYKPCMHEIDLLFTFIYLTKEILKNDFSFISNLCQINCKATYLFYNHYKILATYKHFFGWYD